MLEAEAAKTVAYDADLILDLVYDSRWLENGAPCLFVSVPEKFGGGVLGEEGIACMYGDTRQE